ncbi:calmodulin [Xylariaceae sp. FL0804]|nr:calmodulin [Xylariaceae sp. FL0804]
MVSALLPPFLSPPKRKAAAATASAAPRERQSKLAKEHGISAREEREIKEAFALFAEPAKGEKEGLIPTGDVRRAMVALGIPPSKAELAEFLSILDPEDEGRAPYEPFVAVCALQLHARDDDLGRPESAAHRAEVDAAFRLFTTGASAAAAGGGEEAEAVGGDERLTLAHLKRVAATLRRGDNRDDADDNDKKAKAADDALLRDMILEANGGAGVGRGVSRDEFEEVMRRAGAWK